MYICIYVYIYIYIYIYVSLSRSLSLSIYIYIYIYMCLGPLDLLLASALLGQRAEPRPPGEDFGEATCVRSPNQQAANSPFVAEFARDTERELLVAAGVSDGFAHRIV